MRDDEAGLVENLILVDEQVEVDRARAEARAVACASELALHVEQAVEQRAWLERGLEPGGAVEEARLVEVADRIGLAERRDGDDVLAEQLERAAERRLPVAEVRAKPYPGTRHGLGGYPARMRRLAVLAALFAVWAAPAHAALLVQLNGESGAFALQAAGGTLVSPELRLWKIPDAASALSRLRAAGAVSAVEPDRILVRPAAFRDATDPLVPQEWWRPVVGADSVTPPGPGVPVTVIDAGLDLSHPEFAGRPNTTALNPQTLLGEDNEHATAVSSVVAAPVNGFGVVGVYPQAVLRAFDASPFADIDEAALIHGVVVAAQAGRGVVNISLFSADKSDFLAQAIIYAFGRGTIVVVAAGNQFENGNPPSYPADDPHVLTVAGTTEANQPAPFSGSSAAVDLAAPGVDIPAAVPFTVDASGYSTLNGTSFASPQVARRDGVGLDGEADARDDAGLRPDAPAPRRTSGRPVGTRTAASACSTSRLR